MLHGSLVEKVGIVNKLIDEMNVIKTIVHRNKWHISGLPGSSFDGTGAGKICYKKSLSDSLGPHMIVLSLMKGSTL